MKLVQLLPKPLRTKALAKMLSPLFAVVSEHETMALTALINRSDFKVGCMEFKILCGFEYLTDNTVCYIMRDMKDSINAELQYRHLPLRVHVNAMDF